MRRWLCRTGTGREGQVIKVVGERRGWKDDTSAGRHLEVDFRRGAGGKKEPPATLVTFV